MRPGDLLDAWLGEVDAQRLDAAIAAPANSGPNVDAALEVELRPNAEDPWPLTFELCVVEQADGVRLVDALVRDRTRESELRAELDEEKARLDLLTSGTQLGTWDWNPQTDEVQFNAPWCEILGYAHEEIADELEEWQRRVHPDDLARCYEDIQAHMEGRTPNYRNVHRMRHKDGHWVHILDRGRIAEWDGSGNPVRFIGTHTDISAQVEAELHARRAAESTAEFLGILSCEVRQPLDGLRVLIDVLADEPDATRRGELVGLMRDSTRTLQSIVADLFDLTSIESGASEHALDEFVPAQLAMGSCALYTDAAGDKGIQMDWLADPSADSAVLGDATRIQRVLSNLLSNAVKYTERGFVRVAVRTTDAQLVIAVSGHGGCGIADVETIWAAGACRDPHDPLDRPLGSAGFGLVVSRRLVESLGGTLTATSAVGQGSTFELSIPIERPESIAAARDELKRLRAARADGVANLRVLVAEDNPVNLRVARGLLAQFDVHVDCVADGMEAVEAVRQRPYDLILMDVHMPRMDGVEATRRILATPEGGALEIHALTADTFGATRERCLAAGMRGLIAKPFGVEALREILADAAARRSSSAA